MLTLVGELPCFGNDSYYYQMNGCSLKETSVFAAGSTSPWPHPGQRHPVVGTPREAGGHRPADRLCGWHRPVLWTLGWCTTQVLGSVIDANIYLHRYTAVSLMLVCVYTDVQTVSLMLVCIYTDVQAVSLMLVCIYAGTWQCHWCKCVFTQVHNSVTDASVY